MSRRWIAPLFVTTATLVAACGGGGDGAERAAATASTGTDSFATRLEKAIPALKEAGTARIEMQESMTDGERTLEVSSHGEIDATHDAVHLTASAAGKPFELELWVIDGAVSVRGPNQQVTR